MIEHAVMLRRPLVSLSVALGVAFGAPGIANGQVSGHTAEVPVRAILGSELGLQRPLRALVTTQGDWERLWHEVHRASLRPPPVPTIDFSKEMVLVASMGTQRALGGKITIGRVVDVGD